MSAQAEPPSGQSRRQFLHTTVPGARPTIVFVCVLGINPARHLRDDSDRPVPITDRGEPVRQLFG